MKNILSRLLLLGSGLMLASPGSATDRMGFDAVQATRLPVMADDLRQMSVPESDLREILEAARARGMGASEATDALENVKGSEKEGHLDNLGTYVKSKLEEGLRGRELAAAIHEEKARRRGDPPGHAHGHDQEHGQEGRGNENAGRGRDEDRGGGNADHGKSGKNRNENRNENKNKNKGKNKKGGR
jgi:hypothetical protein